MNTVSDAEESQPKASVTVSVKTVPVVTVAVVLSALVSLIVTAVLVVVQLNVLEAVSLPFPFRAITVAVPGQISVGDTFATTFGEGRPMAETLESEEHPVSRSVIVRVKTSPLQPYPIVAVPLGLVSGKPLAADH